MARRVAPHDNPTRGAAWADTVGTKKDRECAASTYVSWASQPPKGW
jgi:hypothetical protein